MHATRHCADGGGSKRRKVGQIDAIDGQIDAKLMVKFMSKALHHDGDAQLGGRVVVDEDLAATMPREVGPKNNDESRLGSSFPTHAAQASCFCHRITPPTHTTHTHDTSAI